MKIASSNIAMSGNSSHVEIYTKEESLKAWVGDQRPDFEGQQQPAGKALNIQKDVLLELSEKGKALLAESAQQPANDDAPEIDDWEDRKMTLLQKMIEALTGKKIRFYVPKVKLDQQDIPIHFNPPTQASGTQPVQVSAPPRQGWGVEYDSHEAYYEQEKMSFAAEGTVKTADGKEISFSVQLNMSREFAAQQDISFRDGDAKRMDPLVINFSGNAPELTNNKFSFDLDSNGSAEQISFVAPGSGFLALDLNNDGVINNGGELFGPQSGDGFSDLSKYDSDGNQWIDENDPIYDKLRVWTKDADGTDRLFAIGEKGVGAIYLGNVNTDYSMKDSENNLQGQVKKSGIFLNENGTAGTIQHIDLAV